MFRIFVSVHFVFSAPFLFLCVNILVFISVVAPDCGSIDVTIYQRTKPLENQPDINLFPQSETFQSKHFPVWCSERAATIKLQGRFTVHSRNPVNFLQRCWVSWFSPISWLLLKRGQIQTEAAEVTLFLYVQLNSWEDLV